MISMMNTGGGFHPPRAYALSKSSKRALRAGLRPPTKSSPITFFSLNENLSDIQRMYKDVSGVYMLISPTGRRYIGSSVDLARRMQEYSNIMPSAVLERLKVVLNENYPIVVM